MTGHSLFHLHLIISLSVSKRVFTGCTVYGFISFAYDLIYVMTLIHPAVQLPVAALKPCLPLENVNYVTHKSTTEQHHST
jgi:hypothetical protein